jgi:hypothetical protein
MHETKKTKTKCGITGLLITPDRAGQQRRLGKAYRLILSYEPKKASAEGGVGEAVPQADNLPLAPE